MKNYAKKYLSLFVAVLMAVTMLIPTAVFAEDNQFFKPADVTVTASPETIATDAESKTITLTTTVTGDSLKYFNYDGTNATYSVKVEKDGVEVTDFVVPTIKYDNNGVFVATYKPTSLDAGIYTFEVTVKGTSKKDNNPESVTKSATVTVTASGDAEGYRFDDDNILLTDNNGVALEFKDALNDVATDAVNNGAYTVSSSDTTVAEVSKEGGSWKVVARGKTGIATLSLTQLVSGAKPVTCKVYVKANDNKNLVSSIAVDKSDLALVLGGTADDTKAEIQLTAKDMNGDAIPSSFISQLVELKTTATTVTNAGSIDSNGKVTVEAANAGKETLDYKYVGNDAVHAKVNVTVTNAGTKVSGITIRDAETNQEVKAKEAEKIGEKINVVAAVKPFAAANKTLKWTSSNDAIASVAAAEDSDTSDDLYPATITVNGYGEATITATATDGSSTHAELKVTLSGIELVKDSINANVGDEFTIPYTAYGVDDLLWKSNNMAVATVDGDGKVTVKGYGVAVITGTYNNGKKVTFTVYSKLNNGTAVYRVYNPNSGEHFYTTDKAEKDGLVKLGWNDEGIGWYGATEKDGVAVYRLYNANAGEHHYTTSASEKATLVAAGWKDEGISFYAAKSATSYPVYRNYNPNAFANNHNYSTNVAEYRTLLDAGWKDEGVAFYAVNPGTNG